jgi:hypothetical protein
MANPRVLTYGRMRVIWARPAGATAIREFVVGVQGPLWPHDLDCWRSGHLLRNEARRTSRCSQCLGSPRFELAATASTPYTVTTLDPALGLRELERAKNHAGTSRHSGVETPL